MRGICIGFIIENWGKFKILNFDCLNEFFGKNVFCQGIDGDLKKLHNVSVLDIAYESHSFQNFLEMQKHE